jgi:hypothetical protein
MRKKTRASASHLALAFASLVLCLTPKSLKAKDYFIHKGQNFAEGTLNLNHWFMGTKFEFKAAFNESNIYTLPESEQADSNKLFGFSDCKTWAQESSARFGWRWYNNRLEITAVSHYDGRWHLHEIIGVADLNKVYDFKIELSEDKSQYLFTFNKEKTIAMKRDCTDDSMLGYYLYPYFGGSEKSPKDMVISVWTKPHANFALQKAGPNPVKAGEPLNLQLLIGENMEIKFEVFNLLRQLVFKTDSIPFDASDETQLYILNLPSHLSSGIYLIRPMALNNPEPLPGFVVGSGGDSLKLVYLK